MHFSKSFKITLFIITTMIVVGAFLLRRDADDPTHPSWIIAHGLRVDNPPASIPTSIPTSFTQCDADRIYAKQFAKITGILTKWISAEKSSLSEHRLAKKHTAELSLKDLDVLAAKLNKVESSWNESIDTAASGNFQDACMKAEKNLNELVVIGSALGIRKPEDAVHSDSAPIKKE